MNTGTRGTAENATSNYQGTSGLLFSEMSSCTMELAQGGTLRKHNRWRRRIKKSRRRFPGRNRHHLHPKSLGGDNSFNNLLLIDVDKHVKWHALWGNRTAEEVLALLERVVRAKKHQKHDHTKAA